MPYAPTLQKKITIDAVEFIANVEPTPHTFREGINATIPVAHAGTLTTRTSTSVGTLTMASGHGITTASKIDIYFAGGIRRQVLVGTVSVNSVPFTLGTGDDLPPLNDPVKASVESSITVSLDCANIVCLGAMIKDIGSTKRCMVSVGNTSGSYTEAAYFIMNDQTGQNSVNAWPDDFVWTDPYDGDNPLGSTLLDTIKITHEDTATPGTFVMAWGI